MKYQLLSILFALSNMSNIHPICYLPEDTDHSNDNNDYELTFLKSANDFLIADIKYLDSSIIPEDSCLFAFFVSLEPVSNTFLELFFNEKQQVYHSYWDSSGCKVKINLVPLGIPSIFYSYMLKIREGFLNFVSSKNVSNRPENESEPNISYKRAVSLNFVESQIYSFTGKTCSNNSSFEKSNQTDYMVLTGFIKHEANSTETYKNKIEMRDSDDYTTCFTNKSTFVYHWTNPSNINPFNLFYPELKKYSTQSNLSQTEKNAKIDEFKNNEFRWRCNTNLDVCHQICKYCCNTPSFINDDLKFEDGWNFVYIYLANTGGNGGFDFGLRDCGSNITSLLRGFTRLTRYRHKVVHWNLLIKVGDDQIPIYEMIGEVESTLYFEGGGSGITFTEVTANDAKKSYFYFPIGSTVYTLNEGYLNSNGPNGEAESVFSYPSTHSLVGNDNFEVDIVFQGSGTDKIHFSGSEKPEIVLDTAFSAESVFPGESVDASNLVLSIGEYWFDNHKLFVRLSNTSIPPGKYKIGTHEKVLVNQAEIIDFTKTVIKLPQTIEKGEAFTVKFILKDSNGYYFSGVNPTYIQGKSAKGLDCSIIGLGMQVQLAQGVNYLEYQVKCDSFDEFEMILAKDANSLNLGKKVEFVIIDPNCGKPGFEFKDYSTNECLTECPSEKPFNFQGQCLENCPEYASFYLPNKICISRCREFIYGSQCIEECPNSLKIQGNYCVNECTEPTLLLDGNQCVEQCTNKYIEDGKCVDKCSQFAKRDFTCVESCIRPYLYLFTEGETEFCLDECPEGFFPDIDNVCGVKPECVERQELILNRCANCDTPDVWLDGQCLDECPEGFTALEGICQRCEGFIVNGECISECPPNTESVSKETYSTCVSCVQLGKVIEDGKCKEQCSEFKVEQQEKGCVYCEHAYFEGKCIDKCPNEGHADEKTKLCISCESKWAFEDGSCTENCPYFEYFENELKKCIKCASNEFFFEGTCLDYCPENTETIFLNRKCVPVPANCSSEANLCLNRSNCQQITSKYAGCGCFDKRFSVTCFSSSDDLNETALLTQNALSDKANINLLRQNKIISLLKEGYAQENSAKLRELLEAEQSVFSTLEIQDTLLISDKSTAQAESTLNSLRSIGEAQKSNFPSETLFFKGLNFKYAFGSDISVLTDVSECQNKIAESLKTSASQVFVEFFEFSSEVSAKLTSTVDGLQLNKFPFIAAIFYYSGEKADHSVCDLSEIKIEYSAELPDEDSQAKTEELSQKGINAFDSEDNFFTDVCDIKQSNSDTTLSSRKREYYLDPREVCGQREGQVCTIDSMDMFNRPICSCKTGSTSFMEVVEEYGKVITESNIRLVLCYNLFFSRKSLQNYGFWVTGSIIVFFIILQICSAFRAVAGLKDEELREAVHASAVHLDKTPDELHQKGVKIVLSNAENTQISARPLKNKGIRRTNMDLDCMSFPDKVKYDKRSVFYFVGKAILRLHPYANAAWSSSLYFLLHMRLFLLMTAINLEFCLNALFFSDEVIDKRAEQTNTVKC